MQCRQHFLTSEMAEISLLITLNWTYSASRKHSTASNLGFLTEFKAKIGVPSRTYDCEGNKGYACSG